MSLWKAVDVISSFCWKIICKILGKENNTSEGVAFSQFIRFGVVGLSNTLLSYCVTIAFLALFQHFYLFERYDYLLAQFIGFVISVAWSYYWNNRCVFVASDHQKRVWWKALLKTYAAYSFSGVLLSSILSYVLVTYLGVSKYLSPLLILIVTVPVNFLINKYWTFK